MNRFGLPTSALLKKSWQYQEVYRTGKRLRGNGLTIIHRVNPLGTSRLGISAHGFKKAVRRNRIKRIIREYFRLHGEQFIRALPSNKDNLAMDVIFAVRKEFAPLSLRELSEFLDELVKACK